MSYQQTIEHLIRERAHEIGQLSWRQDMGRQRWATIMASILEGLGMIGLVSAILCAAYSWYSANPPAPEWLVRNDIENREGFVEFLEGVTIVLAAILIPVGMVGRNMSVICKKALAEQEAERAEDKDIRRQWINTDMADRMPIVNRLTEVQIEDLRTRGIFTAEEVRLKREQQARDEERAEVKRQQEWEAEQKRKEREFQADQDRRTREHQANENRHQRDHQASESAKDRAAHVDRMIAKVEADIRLLSAKMELATPEAYRRSEVDMINPQHRLNLLKKINEYLETDPVLHKQLYEQYEREMRGR